jgi:3-phenylpropionate/trans-cinnamate dioxygenase ferredoxin reductase subunit
MVSELVARNNRVAAIRTSDGREFPADLAIIGIGILPNAEIAKAAGIECRGGIVVDACSRTSDPAIVAAGDCTTRRLGDGNFRGLESVQNATEQAKSAAAALLGRERPFESAPWFWSDQYEIKLQMVGLSSGFDQVVTRGNPADHKFSAFYYRQGQLVAIDSLNQPAEHLTGRKLLDRGLSPSSRQVADTGFSLNELLT